METWFWLSLIHRAKLWFLFHQTEPQLHSIKVVNLNPSLVTMVTYAAGQSWSVAGLSRRCAAPPSADSSQIHKHTQHITGDLKVAVHIYHSEYASVSEHYVPATLKKERKENMIYTNLRQAGLDFTSTKDNITQTACLPV
ncbi:hypothetical protein ABVT39_019141 [Epinephelus coioides]